MNSYELFERLDIGFGGNAVNRLKEAISEVLTERQLKGFMEEYFQEELKELYDELDDEDIDY